jgi:hypothetical protein
MSRLTKEKLGAVAILVVTIGLSLLLVSIPTEKLIAYVGTDNVYLFMYLIAFIGSITTFASVPYPLILIGLAAGGIDPLFIGLTSALGVITADTFTFYAARKGRALLGERLQNSMVTIASYVEKYPRLLTPGLVLYGTLSPLSNDFAVISLSLMRFTYYRVVVPLAFGNVAYNVGMAYLGVYAYDWIMGLG